MNNFTTLKKEILEAMEKININNLPNFITDSVKLINPKLRCYYNFSINDFKTLLENSSTYDEYAKIIVSLDPHKQYSFYTQESLNDLLDYCLDSNDIIAHDEIKEKAVLHGNLYWIVNDLNKKHWL